MNEIPSTKDQPPFRPQKNRFGKSPARPQLEIAHAMKLEMHHQLTCEPFAEIIRNSTAESGIAEEAALTPGMAAKSKEFVDKGAEVYAQA